MKKLMYFLVFLSSMAFCQAQNYYGFNWRYTEANFASNNAEIKILLEDGDVQTVFTSFGDANISRKMLNLPSKIKSVEITISFQPQQGPGCSKTERYDADSCGYSFSQVCASNIPSGSPAAQLNGAFRLIEIEPPVLKSFKACEEIEIPIEFVAPCSPLTQSLIVENWQFKLPGQAGAILPGHAGERTLRFTTAEFTALGFDPVDYLNLSENIEFRPIFELYPASEVLPYRITIRPCPPNLVGDPITEAASCFGANDGEVTLRFDRNAFEDGNYQMRYYVFDGNANLNFNPNTQNPPSTVEEYILTGLTPANDGTGDYLGTLPIGLGTGMNGYKIVYQEFLDDGNGVDILVNGRGLSPIFNIPQPTQIIATATFLQATCSGDSAEITFSASGGDNLDPGGTYSYDYRAAGNANNWIPVDENPLEILPTMDPQNIEIRAKYTFAGETCIGDEEPYLIGVIDAEIEGITFSNTTGGSASSVTGTEGVISTNYAGGSAPYTFELTKKNEATGDFETVLNPTDIPGLNSIEFRDLGVGTYRITVLANGCPSTTGDIEVTPSPAPQLGVPQVVSEVFCNGGSDGVVSVTVTGAANPFQYQYRLLDDGGNELRRDNDSTSPLEIENLSSGNYTLEVIFDTGSFGPPASGVASVPFSISDPNPLTFSITDIAALDCNASSDGYIEIQVSETGNFQYTHRDLNTWVTLDPNNRIPAPQSGDYDDLIIRKEPRAGDTVFCASNEIDGVFVPGAITVSEVLAGHQNVTTNNGNDGAIQIEVSGGNPGVAPNEYSYIWNGTLLNGGTYSNNIDKNIQNLQAGSYSVRVIDDKSCEIELGPIEITEPGDLAITITDQSNPCFGQNNGSITTSVAGTGPSYTYQWSELTAGDLAGETGANITNIGPGTYTLNVIDNGTTPATVGNSLPVIIVSQTEITADIETTASCSGDTIGTIIISNVQGGEPGNPQEYTYSIDGTNFQNELIIPDLADQTYTVWVRDGNGCDGIFTGVVVEQSPPIVWDEPNTVVTPISAQGVSDGTITLAFTSDATNYTYRWNGPGTVNETTQNLSGKATGTYTVIVTNEDECSLERIFTIGEPGILTITIVDTNNPCFGQNNGNITTSVAGTGPSYTYQWSELTAGDLAGETGPDITNIGAGTYTLNVIDNGTIPATVGNSQTVVIVSQTEITADITTTPSCENGGANGTIVLSNVQGGEPGNPQAYTYSIDGTNFQNELIIPDLADQTYTVWVRDGNGCDGIFTGVVVEQSPPIVWDEPNTVVTPTSAQGVNDGTITLAFTSDATNYTYRWNGPGTVNENTQNLTGKAVGTYTVIVTNEDECSLERIFTIGEPGNLTITIVDTNNPCFGENNGSITTSVAGTGPSYTYQWSEQAIGDLTGETGANITNIGPGTYTLNVIDNGTIPATVGNSLPVIIVSQTEITADIETTTSCSGDTSGKITLSNVQGGEPGNPQAYIYSIDGTNFQNELIIEDLVAQTYTVWVRDGNGCDGVFPGIVIGTSPAIFWDEPNTLITRASGIGANDGAIAPVFIGGTQPLTYLWSANTNDAVTQNITGLTAGIYTVTVTDAANCSVSESFEVTEVGPLSITNIAPSNALCRGEATGGITTTVTGEGTITYQWTLADGSPVPVSNGTNTQNIDGVLAGSYVLTATDDNGTAATAPIAIGEPTTSVTITNITPTDVSCFGANDGTLEIQAAGGTGPYTYSLNGGAFQTSPVFGNLFANSYTLSVQDANACEFAEPTPILILEPQELNLVINEQRPVTAANATNGAIFITVEGGSGNYSYQWDGPDSFSSTEEDILNLAAGEYNLIITDDNFGVSNGAGCRLISAPIAITEPGQLIANLNQTVLLECSGDDFAEITANVQGGVSPYIYVWFQVTNGNNSLLIEDTEIIGSLSVGTYFVRATDDNSITVDSNPITITAPTPVEITVDNTTNVLCAGQPTGAINISVSGGTPPYQYFWSNAATVADISSLDAGEYIVDVEDAAGCIAQSAITITAPDDAIQIVDVTVNNVSAYQALDGSISVGISGGLAPYTYAWTRLSDNSNAGNQATISNLAADSYSILVSDANGCNVTETYEVTQPDILEETIIQPSCSGDSDGSVTILVNQGNGTFTYLWSTGATANNITNLTAGSYTVTVTGLADGPVTRTYLLENPVPLEVNLGVDRVLCADQTLELDASVDDATATYAWSSDNGFTSSTPIVELSETGNYTVTVQSQTGCTAQGTIFIDISTDQIDAEFAMSSQAFVGETIVAVDISFPIPDGIEWIVPIGAEVITQDTDAIEFSFAEAGEYEIEIITTQGDCIAQRTKKILVVAKDGLIQEDDDKSGQKLVENFLVYPNPTSGQFTADVSLSERGDISIKVFSFANNGMVASKKERGETDYSVPFDISGMPSGVYAVLLETPYGTSLRKIIIR